MRFPSRYRAPLAPWFALAAAGGAQRRGRRRRRPVDNLDEQCALAALDQVKTQPK
jgi:hypothetical protein